MLRTLAATLTTAALLTSCGSDSESSMEKEDPEPTAEPETLEDTYDTCASFFESDLEDQFGDTAPPVEDLLALEDDDTTIVVNPPDNPVLQTYVYRALECVLVDLDAPDYVKDDVLKTPATDGPQTKSWDDVTIEYDIPGPDFANLSATIQRTPAGG